MAFQYAGYAIPQAPKSSLAALLEGFQQGQQKRWDEDAYEAAAALGGASVPQQPMNLAALAQQPAAAPAATPPPIPVVPGGVDPNHVPAPPPQPSLQTALNGYAAKEAADTIPPGYMTTLVQRESGGNPTAKNPNSSATGLVQITDGTWQGLMQQHPELGLTPDGRTDPKQSMVAARALTLDNAKSLSQSGIPINSGTLYAAHFLGPAGAASVLSAPDNAPVASLVPQAAAANPQLRSMTVGQFKQWAAGGGGGQQTAQVAPAATAASAPGVTIPGQVPLPDQNTLLALMRSPDTRPLAVGMIQAYRNGQDPNVYLRNLQSAQQISNYGVPSGYQRSGNGGLSPIPGGPQDPNTPENQANLQYKQALASAALERAKSGGTAGVDQNDVAAIGDAIISGDQPPSTTGLYRYGPSVKAYLARQGFDLTRASQDYLATQKNIQSLNSVGQVRLRQSIDQVADQIDLVQNLADEWDNGQFPALNDLSLKAAMAGTYGKDAQSLATRLNAQVNEMIPEIGSVFRGGNTATDEAMRHASTLLQPNWSRQTFDDMMKQLKTNITYRRNSLRQLSVGASANNPYEPQDAAPPVAAPAGQPTTISSDADYDALPSGATFIAPDGSTRRKP